MGYLGGPPLNRTMAATATPLVPSRPSTRIPVRVSQHQADAVRLIADDCDASLSETVRRLLDLGLEQFARLSQEA